MSEYILNNKELEDFLFKDTIWFNIDADQDVDKFSNPNREIIFRPIPNNPNIMIAVKDGDTIIVKNNNGETFEMRTLYVDAKEVAHYQRDKDGNLTDILRESDLNANVQARIFEQVLNKAIDNGYSIEMPMQGVDKYGRIVDRITILDKEGNKVDLTAALIERGVISLHNTQWQKQPDKNQVYQYSDLVKLEAKAKEEANSKYNIHNKYTEMLQDKRDKGIIQDARFTTNKKYKQIQYDLDTYPNKIKIGDIWLDIPPTHINISQLRASSNIPVLGGEAKPIQTPLTNRIIIKLNLIFEGMERINDDLRRILLQFKYCPINIIRSKDLFERLSSENNWLYNAYGQFKNYAVPVTMDEYIIYTIEGHPYAIGLSLQCSLFNFAPYFQRESNSRMEYYEYDKDFYKASIDNKNVELKETLKTKTGRPEQEVFKTTVDLENSIHPYNFIIENELENQDTKFKETGVYGSNIVISKIDKDMTLKEFNLSEGSNRQPTAEDLVKIIAGSSITEIVNSISVSSTNNFAWQPLVGYNQPIAQYLGTGETRVHINIKTNNKDTISRILKTYHEAIINDQYGFYDDRYLVKANLLDLTGNNIFSIQNIVQTNIETKPGWSDLNISLLKSSYQELILENEYPIEGDNYWGLNRIFAALNEDEIINGFNQFQAIQSKNSILHLLPNNSGKTLDSLTLDVAFMSELNNSLSILNGITENKIGDIGPNILNRLSIDFIPNDETSSKILKQAEILQRKDIKIAEADREFLKEKLLKNKNIINRQIIFKIKNTNPTEAKNIAKIFNGDGAVVKYSSYKGIVPKNNTAISDIKDGNCYLTVTYSGQKSDPAFLAEADKSVKDKLKRDIEEERMLGRFDPKPFAAHRYFKNIDSFIGRSNFISKTMGYWYACNKIKHYNKYQEHIKSLISSCMNPIMATDGWKAVYGKQLNMPDIAQKIDYNDRTICLKAAILPKLNRDLGAREIYPEKVSGDLLKNGIFTVSKNNSNDDDFPFDSFSDSILCSDYFSANSSIGKEVNKYINLQKNGMTYFANLAKDPKDTIKRVFDTNNRLIGVVPDGMNSIEYPSDANISNLHGTSDNNWLTSPIKTSASGMFHYNQNELLLSKNAGFYSRSDEAIEQVKVLEKTGFNKSFYSEIANQSGYYNPNILEETLNKYLLTQPSNVGLELAFPTYKMYIIYDETSDYKFSALDYYWDFRLLSDLMIIRDKNNPSHIMKGRVIVDPRYITTNPTVKQKITNKPLEVRNTNRSVVNTDEQYKFIGNRAPLRTGMRICIKLGYNTDPRDMPTVFIGTITGLSGRNGYGVYEIEAQGDGRELTVQPTIRNQTITGISPRDIIGMMLRTNPNIIHFGKVYGGWLERLSRRHQILLGYIRQNFRSGSAMIGAGATGTLALFRGGWFYKALAPLLFGAGAWLADNSASEYEFKKDDIFKKASIDFGDVVKRLKGNVYNKDKASYQMAQVWASSFESGNNPVDDNIFAVNLWSGNNKIAININNSTSVWDIMVNLRRLYPNFCLDVRPYGSRSTIYMGPEGYSYMRTDDPLLAMAPQITHIDKAHEFEDKRIEAIKQMSPFTNQYGDVDLTTISNQKVAPIIPFIKHHAVTSDDDIIYNGIKGTPDRGWNAVAVTLEGVEEPIEFVADADIYPGAIRRRYEDIKWINSDSSDAKRLATQYALGLLKEGVERLYGGILVIKGNPNIEPYDRILIMDKVNQMYGQIQVEAVIHKFDQEFGFTTHIVPNMICSINNTSYLSYGDILRKEICSRFASLNWGDAINIIAGIGLAFIPGGIFLQLSAGLAISYLVSWANNAYQDKKISEAIRNGEVEPYNADTLYINNTLKSIRDLNIYSAEQTVGFAIGHIIRMFRKDGIDISKWKFWSEEARASLKAKASDILGTGFAKGGDVKDAISGTSKAAYQTAATAARLSALRSNLNKVTGIKIENLDKIFENYGNGNKKHLEDIFESLKLADKLPKEAKTADDLFNLYSKKNISIDTLKESFKSSKSTIESSYKKLIAKNGGFTKIARGGFAALAFTAAQSIPMIFDTLAIKATTKAQVITLNPIWHREALLMPGLDGYKNNDIFMHYKDTILAAKATLTEAWNAFTVNNDTLNFIRRTSVDIGPQQAHASVDRSNIDLKNIKNKQESSKRKEVFKSTQGAILKAIDEINKTAKYPVSSEIINAIITQESGWKPDVTSKVGAYGLMQLMPKTARGLSVNPYSIEENIKGGIKFYSQMLDRFNGNEQQALAAYNAGPGAVIAYRDGISLIDKDNGRVINSGKIKTANGIPPFAETEQYVAAVLAYKNRYIQDNLNASTITALTQAEKDQLTHYEINNPSDFRK